MRRLQQYNIPFISESLSSIIDYQMASMDIMSFTTTAITIAVFFYLIFPPLLNCMFFTSLILTIAAATTTKKTKPAPEISIGAPSSPPQISVGSPITPPRIGAPPSTPQIPTKQMPSGDGVRYLRMISSGGGGSLYVVEIKPSDDQEPARLFAGKVMDKSTVAAKTELQILKMLDHPFLPKLHAAMESPKQICLLTELCPAGDLNRLLLDQPLERFPESAVRFYVAEVLLALEYLHMKGIVHRDVKPENILIRKDGHIMLIDFDLSLKCNDVVSKLVTPTNRKSAGKFIPSWLRKPKRKRSEIVVEPVNAWSKSFVGTHEYMAPEMVFRKGHGSAVDWWALGILMYEMFYGTTPFMGPDNESTMANVVVRGLQFPPQPGVSGEAKDLMERLLVKDPAQRLGSTTGAPAIKSHPFFREVNWALVRNTTPPFVPHPSVNNYCYESDCSSFAPANTTSSRANSNTSISRCWSPNSSA